MNTRRASGSTVIFGLFAISMFGLAGAAGAAEITWRFFSYVSPSDFHSHMNRAMADDITEATGRRLVIEHYGAGELPYRAGDILKAVATNQIQMGQVGAGLVAGDVPELDVFSVPFLCTSFEEFAAAMKAIESEPDRILTEKFGIRVVMNWPIPGQNIWSTEKIARLGDLKGKKIRTWNPLQVDMLRTLGAVPTSLDPAEVVTALQRKVVDGAITSSLSANDWKAYDLIKYGYMLNFTMAHQLTVANAKALADLPDDLRAIVEDKIAEWTPKYYHAAEEAENEAMENMQRHGVTLVVPEPEDMTAVRELLSPMWESWGKNNGAVAADLLGRVTEAIQ